MPNLSKEDLVSKIVAQGISKPRAENIVSGLSSAQITNALSSAKALKAIIDIETRNR